MEGADENPTSLSVPTLNQKQHLYFWSNLVNLKLTIETNFFVSIVLSRKNFPVCNLFCRDLTIMMITINHQRMDHKTDIV